MSTLVLECWTEDGDFHIYAESGDDEKEMTFEGLAEEIVAYFETIYNTLEEKKTSKIKDFQHAVHVLSEMLIAPFAEQLKVCSLVRFVVYEDMIRCPFDVLLYDGNHLFLQRSVCYQVEEGEGEDQPSIELGSALLLADLSADPEEACQEVSKLIPESQYLEMKDADLGIIKDNADQVDCLVIRAHGTLDEDNCGGVRINDETISATLVARLEAWIVYFDSCQQGSNMEFIQTFQDKSDVQFYLAPIISNDAGDSSTKTMIWFFTSLLEHKNPIQALFDTRKRLFHFYTTQQKLGLIESLNKAFAFRLYEFVGS